MTRMMLCCLRRSRRESMMQMTLSGTMCPCLPRTLWWGSCLQTHLLCPVHHVWLSFWFTLSLHMTCIQQTLHFSHWHRFLTQFRSACYCKALHTDSNTQIKCVDHLRSPFYFSGQIFFEQVCSPAHVMWIMVTNCLVLCTLYGTYY